MLASIDYLGTLLDLSIHSLRVVLGNSTGNPGVSQANPYPYPQNPVPVARVWGIAGTGHGFFTSAIVAYLMLRDISKSNLCQVIVSYLC